MSWFSIPCRIKSKHVAWLSRPLYNKRFYRSLLSHFSFLWTLLCSAMVTYSSCMNAAWYSVHFPFLHIISFTTNVLLDHCMCWQTPGNSSNFNSNVKFSGKSRDFIKGNNLVCCLMPHCDLYTLQYQNYFLASLGQKLDLIIHLWEFSNSHILIVCPQYVNTNWTVCYLLWPAHYRDVFFFFNVFIFIWRIIALQYCVGFNQTSTWISHIFKNNGLWLPGQVLLIFCLYKFK